MPLCTRSAQFEMTVVEAQKLPILLTPALTVRPLLREAWFETLVFPSTLNGSCADSDSKVLSIPAARGTLEFPHARVLLRTVETSTLESGRLCRDSFFTLVADVRAVPRTVLCAIQHSGNRRRSRGCPHGIHHQLRRGLTHIDWPCQRQADKSAAIASDAHAHVAGDRTCTNRRPRESADLISADTDGSGRKKRQKKQMSEAQAPSPGTARRKGTAHQEEVSVEPH